MTQPNFLQVQTSLDRSCAFVEAHPGLECSERYGAALADMRDQFARQTGATDRRFTEWRMLIAEETKQYRDIKLCYDEVLELAEEHGYEDAPRQAIVYADEAHLFNLIGITMEWLSGLGDEWAWPAKMKAELTKKLAEAASRKASTQECFQQYTVEVKRRVDAYDGAVSLLREFLKEARVDGGKFDDFSRLALDVL